MRTILWAPWRSAYIESVTREKTHKQCLFCELQRRNDEEAHIVYRGNRNYMVLNAYPYTTGHLMIVPYEHVATIEELDDKTILEMIKLTKLAIKALREEYKPDGFNIGINVGKAAGAGVEEHVHLHIVPRWIGDSNFMSIIANTRVLPEALSETYKKLRDKLRNILESKK